MISAGDYADLAGSHVVVITAGVNQKPGETRAATARTQRRVLPRRRAGNRGTRAGARIDRRHQPCGHHHTSDRAHGPAELGAPIGQRLRDPARRSTRRAFRALLGRKLGVDAHHIHAYVLGEHGDSEVLAWSQVTIGGMALPDFCDRRKIPFGAEDIAEIDHGVRRAAYMIIEGKGATFYGIGSRWRASSKRSSTTSAPSSPSARPWTRWRACAT
jgi:L-lactate dehydrogenase